jgi:DNA-binding response OmpR family regulator
MVSTVSEAQGSSSRLGGARADFVASLGRKVADARDVLAALEEDASAKAARDELRRRLHALGTGARLLRFDSMAREIAEAGAVLERATQHGTLREEDVTFIAQVLDDLPALAWGEAPPREQKSSAAESDRPLPAVPLAVPLSALVIGAEAIAEALVDEGAVGARGFEWERTEDAQAAIDLARAYAPDVVVVDADVEAATELVEALLDDPLTEPVPIVVLGALDEAARLVALGVAKTLAKPVQPEVLRRTCEELVDQREGRTMRITLGEPTLHQLGERLAEELKRALVESVDRPARSCRVPLGEGTEVLGALWGAIARVQEIVTAKTGGAIRFGGGAPEGAIALAPWLHHDSPGADRGLLLSPQAGAPGARGRGAAADVRLDRRRVVVADDDPGVTWFISDLLRTAGCEVHEALDGATALDLAFKLEPELVVSDILMPGLDGFALCRALKRDVALRDTPVILLSWKEDLLQRVRELGASAAAYLKKESDSRAIVARVREVLRPRARIEARLRDDGEVRGRLDGLTTRLLLELVCAIRRDARVAVRDASFLYEVDVRDGAPRKATRTASDGSYQNGERVLASLLGVGAGRFVVSPSDGPVRGDLAGTLADQLGRPIAAARGALRATTGARTMNVQRISLDEVALDDYLRATPEPARKIIKRIAQGASPRQMLLGGEVEPGLLGDVLADLAGRGAMIAVRGTQGQDLLGPAVDEAAAVMSGAERVHRSTVPPNALKSAVPLPPAFMRGRVASARPDLAFESLTLSEPPPPRVAATEGDLSPSSLEDAVMREISERSPAPGAAHESTSDPRPLVEPSQLRPRSSNPPAVKYEDEPDEVMPLPSLPPDAIVPAAATSDEMLAAQAEPLREPTPLMPTPADGREQAERAAAKALDTDRTDVDADYAADPFPSAPLPKPQPTEPELEIEPCAKPTTTEAKEKEIEKLDERSRDTGPPSEMARTPLSSSVTTETREEAPVAPRKRSAWGAVVTIGLAAVLVVVGVKWMGAQPQPATATKPAATSSQPAASAAISATAASQDAVTFAEIPPGAEVAPGYGMLEVNALAAAQVRVDGAMLGRGAAVSMTLAPGYHEVHIADEGRETTRVVEVRAGRSTRIQLTQPPP